MEEQLRELLFPDTIRLYVKEMWPKEVEEIRIRAGQPIMFRGKGKEWFLTKQGRYVMQKAEDLVIIYGAELARIVLHMCGHSLYAYEETIKQGYLTLEGGYRVGIIGQSILNQDGSVRNMKHFTAINIRMAHPEIDYPIGLVQSLFENEAFCNTLIFSAPGAGKTTLLRFLIRQLSNGSIWTKGMSIGVVDERSELGGGVMSTHFASLGIRTDILDSCPKEVGIPILLRTMNPAVIAVDEIGSKEDGKVLRQARYCGVKLLATAHGGTISDLHSNHQLKELMNETTFERFISISAHDEHRNILVYDQNKSCIWRSECY